MKKYLLITFYFFYLISYGADGGEKEVWVKQPVFSEIFTENEDENAVGIFLDEKFEYFYNEDGDLQAIHTLHKKIRINNDESINQFNKISVSLANVVELIDIKARAIKPNGKVVVFDKDNIKEIKDEDSGKSYKIFAIDGIENGDDIEYYVIRKMTGLNFGRTIFQFNYPMQKGSFELITPKNLFYDVKGYNGFPNATYSVLEDERNQFRCELENIPLIKEEKFAYQTSLKARIEYRLDYNLSKGKSQRLTWDDAAQRIYKMMYLDINLKHLEKWNDIIPITATTSLEKALQIEGYIKDNILIQENHINEFSNFKYILENKVSSAKGIVGLYVNLFKNIGINHQVVLTSDRSDIKFDRDFQSWNYLVDYLIYLPDDDVYIDPSNTTFRKGCINAGLTATDGLFVKLIHIGSFESAIGEIKYIEPSSYDENYSNMKIDVTIDIDNAEVNLITTLGFRGLSGGYISLFYKMLDEESKQVLLKDISANIINNIPFNRLEVIEKSDIDFMADAEFIFISDINTPSFIEQAGNRLLLNIGETIGQQVEMYFEEDRKALIENDFNRSYYREIIVHIPDGYKIINPEAPDMNFIEKVDDNSVFGFESSHTYIGNEYKIIINEYYKEVFADLSQVDGFKAVVNAAADFNKVVLVLEEL